MALIPEPPNAFDKGLKSRGIEAATLRRFGYFPTKTKDGKVIHVAPYFDSSGTAVAQKVRYVETKDFVVAALPGVNIATCWLFGRQVWGDAGHKKIANSTYRGRVIVVEGEIDALTVAQVTKFAIPVVSINSGASSAKKTIGANIEWLEKFDEVILAFDDDPAGHAARDEAAPLLPPGKVRVVSWGPHKDANGLLLANKPGDIVLAIERASQWAPPGTITGQAIEALFDTEAGTPDKPAISFPWPTMNKTVRGAFRHSDAIVLLAGSGVGKSTFLFECIAHWLDQGLKVATLFLEDTPIDVLNGVLSVASNQRLRLNPHLLTATQKKKLMRSKGWLDRLLIEEAHVMAKTKEALFSKVRYLVGVADVDIIVVDPLSFLVSKSLTDQDERRGIDSLMTELSDLGRTLNTTVFMSHHLSRPDGERGHEEGAAVALKQARGSHGIVMFAGNILALQAPNRADDEVATRVIVKKSRWRGELRDTTVAHIAFDVDTGRLVEVPSSFTQQTMDASLDDSHLPPE